jgi:hypothetical protein
MLNLSSIAEGQPDGRADLKRKTTEDALPVLRSKSDGK